MSEGELKEDVVDDVDATGTRSTENVTNGNSGIRNITRILELKAGIIDSCLGNVLS